MSEDDVRVAEATGLSQAEPAPVSSLAGFDPSREQLVWQAIMIVHGIKAASERATAAREAAKWLFQYGSNCFGKDAATIGFRAAYASSCVGVDEASKYITEAIYAMLPDIILEAKRMVNRDMDALLALMPLRDSDGSPKGGDGLPGSVHDSAAIAQTEDGEA